MLTTNDPTQIEAAVHDSIRAILAERGEAECHFDATTHLNGQLGLSSLDLAVLVVDLEATLGLDPFAILVPVTSVRSVGDVVNAYRLAASGARPTADDGLAVHPKRLVDSRYQKQQTHLGIAQDVVQRIDAVVAAPVGDQQGAIVCDLDEAGKIAARGIVGHGARTG